MFMYTDKCNMILIHSPYVKLLSADHILVPINHRKCHWTLLVLHTHDKKSNDITKVITVLYVLYQQMCDCTETSWKEP